MQANPDYLHLACAKYPNLGHGLEPLTLPLDRNTVWVSGFCVPQAAGQRMHQASRLSDASTHQVLNQLAFWQVLHQLQGQLVARADVLDAALRNALVKVVLQATAVGGEAYCQAAEPWPATYTCTGTLQDAEEEVTKSDHIHFRSHCLSCSYHGILCYICYQRQDAL